MTVTTASSVHPLVFALQRWTELSVDEISSLEAMPYEIHSYRAGQTILGGGDLPIRCFLILEGFVSTSKEVDVDKRQITSLHLPGDMPLLFSQPDRPLDVEVMAISACRVAAIEASALLAICRRHFSIGELLWQCALAVASTHREWIVNIGHRPAARRLAHLLCEIMCRLEALGLAKGKACDLPLTQLHIGQATGLSRIHVNRACQELKKLGLISMEYGRLTVHEWDTLVRLGQFSPEYLCLPTPRWRASDDVIGLRA